MVDQEARSSAATESWETTAPRQDDVRPVFIVAQPSTEGPNVARILIASLAAVAVLTIASIWAVIALLPDLPDIPAMPEPQAVGGEEAPSVQPAVDEYAGPTVDQAQSALKKAEPALYGRLPNPNEPQVGEDGGNTTYTWEYVDKGSSMASVRRVTVSLDDRGRLVDIVKD